MARSSRRRRRSALFIIMPAFYDERIEAMWRYAGCSPLYRAASAPRHSAPYTHLPPNSALASDEASRYDFIFTKELPSFD